MNYRNRAVAALLGLALINAFALPSPAFAASLDRQALEAAALTPYKARYQVSYRGLSGGHIESSLRPGATPEQWIYETRAEPNLFGRIAVSEQARERGTMQISGSGVRPLTFVFDDGTSAREKDVRLAFDWSANLLKGEAKHGPFEMAVTPGTQDTASVQAAMIVELLAGREPRAFRIVTGDKLRDYRYWPEGHATIETPFGKFDTVIWANQRNGSDRVTKVWHAPALGYVPVQAVQYRKGKQETQMRLERLER
jgi:hypothetical protein